MVVVLFGILFCKFEMFNKNKWESLLGSGGSQLRAGRPNFAYCLFLSNGLRIKNGFYSFKWLRKQKKDILWYAKIIFIFWCLSKVSLEIITLIRYILSVAVLTVLRCELLVTTKVSRWHLKYLLSGPLQKEASLWSGSILVLN